MNGNAAVVGNVLSWLAVVPAVMSVIVYAQVTWWRSRWGQHVMTYMASVALVLCLAVTRQLFGDAPWFGVVRICAYALVVVALWWRLAIVFQAYREGSPDESENRRPGDVIATVAEVTAESATQRVRADRAEDQLRLWGPVVALHEVWDRDRMGESPTAPPAPPLRLPRPRESSD